jgi:hypothetical protein
MYRRTWLRARLSVTRGGLLIIAVAGWVTLAMTPWTSGDVGFVEPSLDALVADLSRRGLDIDGAEARRLAAEAILKGVDPYAVLLEEEAGDAACSEDEVVSDVVWPGQVGYVRLTGLAQSAATTIVSRVDACESGGACGMILDLRNAAGEDLEAVISVASVFLPLGDALFEVQSLSSGETNVLRSLGYGEEHCVPFMLLINGGTRGASEILAAALKGVQGCMLLGSVTRGDGALREVVRLADDLHARLATGIIYTQKGGRLQGQGVTPDIETGEALVGYPVPPELTIESEEESDAVRELLAHIGGDTTLRRAVDILLGLRALNTNGKPSVIEVDEESVELPDEDEALPVE